MENKTFREMIEQYNRELAKLQRQTNTGEIIDGPGAAAVPVPRQEVPPTGPEAPPAQPETPPTGPNGDEMLPVPPGYPDWDCEKPCRPCEKPECGCCEPCEPCEKPDCGCGGPSVPPEWGCKPPQMPEWGCCEPCEPCEKPESGCGEACEPCLSLEKPNCKNPDCKCETPCENCTCGRHERGGDSCAEDRPQFHSQTVGANGPVLVQDGRLHETLDIFVNSVERERVVHTKGYGALGCFKPYQCMAPYTKAAFLQDPSIETPVFVRFSMAVSNRGTPDSARNVHGFATKFYTKEGNFDIVGNQIPVFFIRDAIRFPEVIAALKPSPKNNLADPEAIWDFIARTPEALHMVTWLYSDVGTLDSVRTMRGYGINTFVWVNKAGERRYVKYHWIPLAGERCIDSREAQRLACENPDVAAKDLYHTIAGGGKVEYELRVQLMDPCDAEKLPYDPLDDTKVWSECDYPLMPVGRMVLDSNPDDYRTQVEHAAFSPANLVPGIELSADKMLQGRSFVYWDAQRHRLGNDFREMPVNRAPGWSPSKMPDSGMGECLQGVVTRSAIPKTDDFTQAGERYRCLSEIHQRHLVENIAADLGPMPERIKTCVLGYFRRADEEFATRIEAEMNEVRPR